MANRKPTEFESSAMAEQRPKPPEEFTEVGRLRTKHNISRAVFAGVCAAQGWKAGKFVTEAEFLGAVKQFTGAPMSGGPALGKEAAK